MTGRPTLLTPELHDEIVNNLALGLPVADVCDHVGISERSYYEWRQRGQRELDRVDQNPRARVTKAEEPFTHFLQATTRAQAAARRKSVIAISAWWERQTVRNVQTTTTTETRLRKIRQPDGTVIEEPYDYVKTVEVVTVSEQPPDWRAGIDFLKRRDPERWSEKMTVKHEGFVAELLQLLVAGQITEQDIYEELGDDLANQFFEQVGPVSVGAGAPAVES